MNCLTEIFVEKALERAAWLDEQLKKTGRTVGPLHGLPISLKDQIRIKGQEATMGERRVYLWRSAAHRIHITSGYASWVGKYSEHDAVITEILYACGAVPFTMTNVPQTLMASHIFCVNAATAERTWHTVV